LTDPTHPLREKRGDEEGVVFYIGRSRENHKVELQLNLGKTPAATCKDGKPRMFLTFKQVEYLVYWIEKMKLVAGGGRIPLPSTKSILFEDDLDDMVSLTNALSVIRPLISRPMAPQVPLMLTDPELVKRALNRPHQIYNRYKEERKQKAQPKESPSGLPEEPEQPSTPPPLEPAPGPETLGPETTEEAGSDQVDSAAKTAFHRAEQILIVASSAGEIGLPAHLRVEGGNTSGKAAFLSIHFEASGLDTLCSVGWAATWFDGDGEECRDQGMWM